MWDEHSLLRSSSLLRNNTRTPSLPSRRHGLAARFGNPFSRAIVFLSGVAMMSAMSICGYLWLGFLVIWVLWAVTTKRTQTRESVRSRVSYTIFAVAAFYAMFGHEEALGWMRLPILPSEHWIANLGIAITAAPPLRHLGQSLSRPQLERSCHGQGRTSARSHRSIPLGASSDLLGHDFGPDRHGHQPRRSSRFCGRCFLWIGFTLKSRIEERFMTATFGPQYDEYRRTTGGISSALDVLGRLRFWCVRVEAGLGRFEGARLEPCR